MRYIVIGAAGFLGTNLSIKLAEDENNIVRIVDRDMNYFSSVLIDKQNVEVYLSGLDKNSDYNNLLNNQDVVFHMVSTTVPSTSNKIVSEEILENTEITLRILEACILNHVKKLVFLSSGGTVYGSSKRIPVTEDTALNPICSYGTHKLISEKLIQLYGNISGLDYRVIRLSNPYGPYQRPTGKQGVIASFIYNALRDDNIYIYGDGSIIRDYIYIDDAIDGIINITNSDFDCSIVNLGTGIGTSLNEIVTSIENVLEKKLNVVHLPNRSVDVPVSILDIERYTKIVPVHHMINIYEGIKKSVEYYKSVL